MSSRRRRKAKSSQSRAKSGRRKWLLGSGLVLLLLLGIAAVFTYNAIRSYLKSDDFRVMLGSQAGDLLEGEANFAPFEWDGWSVTTSAFAFQGDDGLTNLDAREIEASVDIGAIWGGVYQIEDVRLSEITLLGDFRKKPAEEEPESTAIPVDGGEEAQSSFWDRFLPDELKITGIQVASVNGRALTDDGVWSWSNVAAAVEPGSGKGNYEIQLTGGKVKTPLALVDELTLRSAKSRYSGGQIFLLSSEFSALERARLTMEGDYSMEDRIWQMRGEMTGGRVEEVIAEDWKQRLMGPFEVEYRVSGKPDHDASVRGSIEIKEGILTALPVLDRIAAYANTVRFRRLALSEARLDFVKYGSTLELTNIRLASEGLVRLEGTMRIEGDYIQKGDFRVGVTPGTLAHIPGAETKVFRVGELGLLWTPLTISGPIDSPNEDLSERLIAAAGERMFELAPETGKWALKFSGEVIGESTKAILKNQGVILGTGQELLNQVNDLLQENGEAVIEEGGKVIGNGVGTLFDLFGRPIEKSE